ncbi:hypothetical protein Sta7437_2447 [Stanieria cyanosphaera PCC 7437]|uniref:Uncharacterized protein n=1 Tax=Stanieria cyanosphaera (strain ATCC 29371 / PCC 7437) TaxID=111780 RepID=K9XWD9_STAC7|nr:hypothetical protein [Stanieria cyanosphaera]AFZ35982.1 hypothetical protein Sta7437_2447 [Stanieria cyanosphaera PCC 7437]
MKRINQTITATVALALTVGVSTLATPQPANAQVLELATGALNAIFNRPPKPIPNQSYAFGTNNLNGNNFSLCILPCTPGMGSSPVRLPIPGMTSFSAPPVASGVSPSLPPTGVVPPQGSVSQSQTMVTNQVGTIPPGAVPGTIPPGVMPGTIPPGAIPPQIVQPTPPRPTVVIPPIKLPINLPI